jgi:Bifunctional DNA primase/polymerase, N-terminal
MISVTEYVRWLNRRGIPTFGCHNAPDDKERDKTPLHRGGFYNAQCDPELAELGNWDKYGFLVGVPTGPASGIAVLDIDPRHNGDQWLDACKRRLPLTMAHRTHSGGVHLLFRWRDGLRNSASQIAPGVDVRGEGGYVIWWPARPERGGMVLDFVPLGELPEWPSWIVPPEKKANQLRRGGGGDWYPVASFGFVNYLIERVRSEPEGNRTNCCFGPVAGSPSGSSRASASATGP